MTYKNILQKGAFAALMTAGLMMTVSCNDDDVSPVLEERVLVKEINLEVTPELPLLIGTDTLIKYTVGPDEAFNKEVVWKSTVPDVATVDAEGRITAVKAGNTVISAKPVVGYSATSTINVKVVNEIIHITDINLTNEDLEVFVTSTLPLTWQTTPADPTYPGLIWKSLTPDKATVNEKGEVKGIAEGKARIQVTATDDKHFTKEFEIKVKPIIYIESMEFVKETDKLALGETYTPQMNVTPIDATLSYIVWESSKPDVVEIDEKGHVTGCKKIVCTKQQVEQYALEFLCETPTEEYADTIGMKWWGPAKESDTPVEDSGIAIEPGFISMANLVSAKNAQMYEEVDKPIAMQKLQEYNKAFYAEERKVKEPKAILGSVLELQI